MRNIVLASVVAIGALAAAGSALAISKHNYMPTFGEVYDMTVGGSPMSMQLIEAEDGTQFVIMERHEFEQMANQSLNGHHFTKVK